MPTVSVVIPTYNSAPYLVEAVESVLAQSYQDLEVLVVDDGSTDNTANVMRQYEGRVRYMQQPNQGVAVARNNGIAASKGEYIAFLDADDTWHPDKLSQQMSALAEKPEAGASNTGYFLTNEDMTSRIEKRSVRKGRALDDLLLRGTVVFISTVVCRRDLLEVAGGFDRELSQCADWDMWIRIAKHTDFVEVDLPLVNYRQHGSNMSRNAHLLERDSVLVLKKAFAMEGLPVQLVNERRHALARNYMVLAGTYFHAGKYADFIRCAWRAVILDVKQFRYLLEFPSRRLLRSPSASE